jgi:hypothetical protein
MASIPAELGDWHHAYLRFCRWSVRGVWDKIMAYVVAQGEPKLAFLAYGTDPVEDEKTLASGSTRSSLTPEKVRCSPGSAKWHSRWMHWLPPSIGSLPAHWRARQND